MLLWSTLFKFAENRDLETTNTISLSLKRELVETQRSIKVFWNKNFALFCKFNSIIIQIAFKIWFISQKTIGQIPEYFEILGQFVGCAAKSRIGLILSLILTIRKFLNFYFSSCLFKSFCFCFFNDNNWQNFFNHGAINGSSHLR